MATLTAKERAKLPDRAFAYIDSQGKRRLPIHDAGHVRNALSRFNQVAFEDDAARDRARIRLLNAAKKFGIVPIGFVSAQLQPERKLPRGQVTFLLRACRFRLIETAAEDDRNFVKKGVSWALRLTGRRSPALHAACIELAERLAASPLSTPRWIGRGAFRELTRPRVVAAVQARAKKKAGKK